MENPKNNIKDPKVRAYFEDITEGKEPSVRLSADELEKGCRGRRDDYTRQNGRNG